MATAHPLHPALVHFPIACWTLATAADCAGLFWPTQAWPFAGAMLALGMATALAAIATGFLELLRLAPDHPAMGDLNTHVCLVLAAFCAYLGSLLLRMRGHWPIDPHWPALAFSVVGFLLLCAAGWFGGRLVYHHRVGVENQA